MVAQFPTAVATTVVVVAVAMMMFYLLMESGRLLLSKREKERCDPHPAPFLLSLSLSWKYLLDI
jgi:hypothetical protein